MDPLLDALTLSPAAQLFELEPPRYTSSYGRRTEAIFKTNVPPAPMLISPDNGLVLYERVISTKAEHQLLDKLTKPKYYHPIPNIRKGGDRKAATTSRHNPASCSPAAASPRPHSPASNRPASARSQSSGGGHSLPGSGPASACGAGAGGAAGSILGSQAARTNPALHRAVSCSTGGSGGSVSSGGAGSSSRTTGHSQHGSQHVAGGRQSASLQHRSRSVSPGRAASGGGAAGGGQKGVRRKPLYPEDGPLKDYFSKERASVTATTVFTWGNRYKIGESGTGRVTGSGGGAVSRGGGNTEPLIFTSYAPAQHKPPLRL